MNGKAKCFKSVIEGLSGEKHDCPVCGEKMRFGEAFYSDRFVNEDDLVHKTGYICPKCWVACEIKEWNQALCISIIPIALFLISVMITFAVQGKKGYDILFLMSLLMASVLFIYFFMGGTKKTYHKISEISFQKRAINNRFCSEKRMDLETYDEIFNVYYLKNNSDTCKKPVSLHQVYYQIPSLAKKINRTDLTNPAEIVLKGMAPKGDETLFDVFLNGSKVADFVNIEGNILSLETNVDINILTISEDG